MRSSTCEVEEEQSAPSPVLGRAGEAAAGGEAAEACVGTDTGCRREGDDASGEAAEAAGTSGVGDVAAEAQSSGETAGCGSAVATWVRVEVGVRVRVRG